MRRFSLVPVCGRASGATTPDAVAPDAVAPDADAALSGTSVAGASEARVVNSLMALMPSGMLLPVASLAEMTVSE